MLFDDICAHFCLVLIGRNLTAQLTGIHRGIGGGIQIPETVARSASFSCSTTRVPGRACSQARIELVFLLTVENQIMFNHMRSVFSSRHKNTVYACNTKSIHCNLLSGIISNAPILKRCL